MYRGERLSTTRFCKGEMGSVDGLKSVLIGDSMSGEGDDMVNEIEINIQDSQREREARERRLLAYATAIQESALAESAQVIKELVAERHRLGMTQQDVADITGILPSNLARFESGGRVPTLVALKKYAAAVGKDIEIKVCDVE